MMKPTGIARKLDKLGRIVVPMEARRELGWSENTYLEICQFGGYILLHANDSQEAAAVRLTAENPVAREVVDTINNLSDKDMLLALDLLHRLSD